MSNSYYIFAHFYDDVMGNRPEAEAVMTRLLAKYLKLGDKLLELACGTGAMMRPLSKTYMVDGLDLSDDMLTIAQAKLPKARLFHGDMTSFELSRKYDGIYCIYDSLNHVTTEYGWDKVFASAARHLASGGIFIFDINTLGRLAKISQDPAYALEFKNNYLLMKIHDVGQNIFDFDIRIFEQISKDSYKLHQETIAETAYPLNVVISTLEKHFKVLEYTMTDGSPASEEADERVYFVCQKK